MLMSANQTCSSEEFLCPLPGSRSERCLPQSWKCDGIPDCEDGRDEAECPNLVCSPTEVRCSSGTQCVSPDYHCDGYPDCGDGSDETDCPPLVCPPSQFICPRVRRCINLSERCNGYVDCGDGADEDWRECFPDAPETLTVSSERLTDPSLMGLYRITNVTHSGRPVWQRDFNDGSVYFGFRPRYLFYNGNNLAVITNIISTYLIISRW